MVNSAFCTFSVSLFTLGRAKLKTKPNSSAAHLDVFSTLSNIYDGDFLTKIANNFQMFDRDLNTPLVFFVLHIQTFYFLLISLKYIKTFNSLNPNPIKWSNTLKQFVWRFWTLTTKDLVNLVTGKIIPPLLTKKLFVMSLTVTKFKVVDF